MTLIRFQNFFREKYGKLFCCYVLVVFSRLKSVLLCQFPSLHLKQNANATGCRNKSQYLDIFDQPKFEKGQYCSESNMTLKCRVT